MVEGLTHVRGYRGRGPEHPTQISQPTPIFSSTSDPRIPVEPGASPPSFLGAGLLGGTVPFPLCGHCLSICSFTSKKYRNPCAPLYLPSEGNGSCCLMGTEFQFCKMRSSAGGWWQPLLNSVNKSS